ncbi:MAG: rhomboid family intramembrane serine protease, partial [Bacteroidetes bacterium HGW-Bacteroidetes-22]
TLAPADPVWISEASKALQSLLSAQMDIPTVGASGAIFGILLAFGMLFPNSLIYLYFAIPIKAKWFVILYGGFELYSGIANNPGDNVAHFAHLGGMLFGFILIRFWKTRRYQ